MTERQRGAVVGRNLTWSPRYHPVLYTPCITPSPCLWAPTVSMSWYAPMIRLQISSPWVQQKGGANLIRDIYRERKQQELRSCWPGGKRTNIQVVNQSYLWGPHDKELWVASGGWEWSLVTASRKRGPQSNHHKARNFPNNQWADKMTLSLRWE